MIEFSINDKIKKMFEDNKMDMLKLTDFLVILKKLNTELLNLIAKKKIIKESLGISQVSPKTFSKKKQNIIITEEQLEKLLEKLKK